MQCEFALFECLHFVCQFLKIGEHVLGMCDKEAAGFIERPAVFCAVEQGDAEFVFESLDRASERAL